MSGERFVYSEKPIRLKQRSYQQISTFKPEGLWYSIGDAWAKWCRAENFRTHELDTRHHLDLNGARIASLKSRADVSRFAAQFSTDAPCPGIDWNRVSKLYDGVEMNPYFWDIRHEYGLLWYNGWDCSSGCVWNIEVISLCEAEA